MTIQTAENGTRTLIVQGTIGRDDGKSFRITEVPPLDMVNFMLRLMAALRAADMDEILGLFGSGDDAQANVSAVFSVLRGCDPAGVKALIDDALRYVEISPDPQHPGVFRRLDVANDLKEVQTLGQILGGFARVNVATE
jgi:hypothetical protein